MAIIDKRATIKRVRQYLEDDLDKYRTITANYGAIPAVNYENIKVVASMSPDSTTNRIIKLMDYQAWTQCTENAINTCINEPRKPYKTILQARYLDHLPRWQVAQKIGYSIKQENRLVNRACLNFADVFLMEQIKQGVKDILDLHVYQPEQTTTTEHGQKEQAPIGKD